MTKRWVAELVASWNSLSHGRCRVVNLDGVTSIDKTGKEVLSMTVHDGARFVASGVYTRHLFEQLQAGRDNEKLLG
jgi:hypothetical protein